MPLYGDLLTVKKRLQATEGDAWDASTDAILAETQQWVSALIESETGAVFTASPASATREVRNVPYGTVIVLPAGLTSISALVENPTSWDGTAWSGGVTVPAGEYRLSGLNRRGGYGLIRGVARAFGGFYLITGVWDDQRTGVPDDITATANFLIAELWKKQKASPAGFVGSDGSTMPIRDALKESEVVRTFAKYRVNAGVWV